jgi:hypothetical protein
MELRGEMHDLQHPVQGCSEVFAVAFRFFWRFREAERGRKAVALIIHYQPAEKKR